VVAVGDTTARALEGEGFPAQVIPERPGALEMVSALVAYIVGGATAGGAAGRA
jgi:uroporphyrinogen-III synthase